MTTAAAVDAKHGAVYKCTSCPNATFSKRKNLIGHINRVHFDKGGAGGTGDDDERGDDGTAEDDGGESERDYASPTMAVFNGWCANNAATTTTTTVTAAAAVNATANPSNTVSGSEPCFKCHLCDSSHLDRQGALDHIRNDHAECYEILVSQGAMDNDHDSSAVKQDDVENRKVGCALIVYLLYLYLGIERVESDLKFYWDGGKNWLEVSLGDLESIDNFDLIRADKTFL